MAGAISSAVQSENVMPFVSTKQEPGYRCSFAIPEAESSGQTDGAISQCLLKFNICKHNCSNVGNRFLTRQALSRPDSKFIDRWTTRTPTYVLSVRLQSSKLIPSRTARTAEVRAMRHKTESSARLISTVTSNPNVVTVRSRKHLQYYLLGSARIYDSSSLLTNHTNGGLYLPITT